MAPFDLEAMLQEWKEGYATLASISMQQFMIVKDASEMDPIWEQIRQLSEKKITVQEEIERLQSAIAGKIGMEEMKRIFREEIQASAESARVLTFETSRKIELLMFAAGTELGSTKSHRKAFEAYTGWNSDSPIAYFFDEKK